MSTAEPSNESLDPEDWPSARELAHTMLDDTLDFLSSVNERPAWQSVPHSTRRAIDAEVPWDGQPLSDVYDEFRKHILPYPTGNIHPRFFGWVMGTGTVTGMLADMLASGMNCHVAGYDQSATFVERKVIDWLAELLGFPASTSGLLVSGGTMANLNALTVARNHKAGFDLRSEGLARGGRQFAVYGSVETHGWIKKACELIGLGTQAFRAVPVDSRFRIQVPAARQMIKEDLEAGLVPFCINGNIGTVNTAAIDDAEALRGLADEFGLWFHIDGAFGALAALAPDSRDLVKNQALADSIAFDLHKWGYMPYEVGCVLVRDPETQLAAFSAAPAYLQSAQRGIAIDTTEFADRGIQLSRGFRALKVWMSLKEQGVLRIGRVIEQNIQQARFLEQLIGEEPTLELLAPVSLNTVCFRYACESIPRERLNWLNQEVLLRVQESGVAVPSQTILNGKFAIRVCITNHRTTMDDMKVLADSVIAIGKSLASKQ